MTRREKRGRSSTVARVWAIATAAALLSMGRVHAAVGPEPPPSPEESFNQGQALDKVDPHAAARAYLTAYRNTAESKASHTPRALALSRFVNAQQRAYANDKDLKRLRDARSIAREYLDEIGRVYGEVATETEGYKMIAPELAELDREIPPEPEVVEPRPVLSEEKDGEPQPPEPEVVEPPHVLPEGKEAEPQPPKPTPTPPSPQPRPTEPDRRLAAGGWSGVATGAAFGVGMGVSLLVGHTARGDFRDGPTRADRDAAHSRGTQANAAAIATGVTAGMLIATGAVLLILAHRRKRSASATRSTHAMALTCSPWGLAR